MENRNRQLMWHGMLLLILGMTTGIAEPYFANVRMGLAAHLEGLMNGMLLLALGAIWTNVVLTRRGRATAYWAALYGTYVNYLFTVIAATLGTGALSPVLAPGFSAPLWQEILVTAGFASIMLSMFVSSGLVLWGLRTSALKGQGVLPSDNSESLTARRRAESVSGQPLPSRIVPEGVAPLNV